MSSVSRFSLSLPFANLDFSRTVSLSEMFKFIPLSGFIDFWKENRPWQISSYIVGTDFILLSEPQIRFNFNVLKGRRS